MPADTVPSIPRAEVQATEPVVEVSAIEQGEESRLSSSSSSSQKVPLGGEKGPQFPFQSVFFMGVMDISKLVALSAWKDFVEKSSLEEKPKPSSPPSPPHLSASSSPSSSTPASSPATLSSTPPSSSSSPSSSPSPSPSSPQNIKNKSSMPPPSRGDEWNEACLGIWKKSSGPSAKVDSLGKCIGISIVKASTQKELDELNKRPVAGVRVCILSEELEKERREKELKAKAAKGGVPEPQPMSVTEAAKEFIDTQVKFTKKLGEKLLSGEIIIKTANFAFNSVSRLAKDLRDRFGGRE